MDDLNEGGKADAPTADAKPDNWVDRHAPKTMRPYLRLIRADRPIGVWLLLWPCWWSVALAALARGDGVLNLWFLILFAIGAFVMRGAGCVYNDIVDRDIDRQVTRTASRPLPSGQISVLAALIFLSVLCVIGLGVLLPFNFFTIVLGFASLLVVAVYPFMKRLTMWPQAVLGVAFSWGALMGWAATFAGLDWPPLLLCLAAMFWTIGYDTIYAHQDKEDDALLGLGSTALAFGAQTKIWIAVLYAFSIVLLLTSGLMAGGGVIFFLALSASSVHLAWQVTTLDTNNPDNCLVRFRSNRDFGTIVFAGLFAEITIKPMIGSLF